VVDAGLASLATFASGITGVNLLSDADTGVYGVFFTAFILGGVLISDLVYVPSQVIAVAQQEGHRLDGLRRSIRLAIAPSLVASLIAIVAAALNRDLTTSPVLMALTLSTGATIVVSAMQDHVRRMLHIADRSWQAATVSATQLLGVATMIPTLILLDVERAWVPFGSLCFANVVSLTTGLLLAGAHRRTAANLPFRFGELARSGKWLVMRSAIPSAAAFLAAIILSRLAGPEAYGYAEAARQVAQPVTVLALGLTAVLGPRAVRAGMQTDTATANRGRRIYALLVVAAAGGYALVAGPDWVGNPMSLLVPKAYVVSWLVPATVLANTIAAMVLLLTNEMLGAAKERILALLATISAPALLLAAATAGTTESFARPLGFIIEGAIVMVGAWWWLRRHYAPDPHETSVGQR
jgi:hypothetical protein